jgi:geranylgeranyl transferase type-2 subunit alpha
MHGRAKLERPPSAQELEADQQKSAAYSKLVGILQTLKSNGDRSEQTLELSGQMLRKNPDYYSLWNFRREILISNNANIGLAIKMDTKINSEGGMTIAEKELRLSQEAIIKNPKSYGAWYHRVWIIDRFEVDISSEIGEKLLCYELRITDFDFLNFACRAVQQISRGRSAQFPLLELQASLDSRGKRVSLLRI